MDPESYPSQSDERERYNTHNNDPTQVGYRQFVSPIVNSVVRDFSTTHKGLDYGAGISQIVTLMLSEQGYHIAPYDPLFCNDKTLLENPYNYITCCEVVEHFHHPDKEFLRLFNLLLPNGKLYIKTDLYDNSIDFNKWYYKDDPTHTFFYKEDTLKWIKKAFGYKDLTIEGRLIILSK